MWTRTAWSYMGPGRQGRRITVRAQTHMPAHTRDVYTFEPKTFRRPRQLLGALSSSPPQRRGAVVVVVSVFAAAVLQGRQFPSRSVSTRQHDQQARVGPAARLQHVTHTLSLRSSSHANDEQANGTHLSCSVFGLLTTLSRFFFSSDLEQIPRSLFHIQIFPGGLPAGFRPLLLLRQQGPRNIRHR